VVTYAHHIAPVNDPDIATTSLHIAVSKARDIKDTSSFNADSNAAASKQDHVDRQNRYL
jgi:hypothetical protein